MGGDFGPRLVVPATLAALRRHPQLQVLLLGEGDDFVAQTRTLEPTLAARITVVECGRSVTGDDKPSAVLRRKLDSSQSQALAAVAAGRADCALSAGNTGALMAFGLYHLGTLDGIERPAICTALPTVDGSLYMLDLGANIEASGAMLHQFALLATLLAQAVGQRSQPQVKLLNIGSEVGKGLPHVLDAAARLQADPLIHYGGFIEGDQLYDDGCDIVVCDGYSGNLVLKTSEGLVKMVSQLARQLLVRSRWVKLPLLLIAGTVRKLFARFNPGRYNGAFLLGLNGLVIKSHGSANQRAFEFALNNAVAACQNQLLSRVQEALYTSRTPAAQAADSARPSRHSVSIEE